MPIISRATARPARATPASCAWKARTTPSPTATSCTSVSRTSAPLSLVHSALVADGAEVLVDAEDDQDEFCDDAREHDADEYAGDGGEQHQESAERADRHRGKAGKDAGNAEQADQRNHEPVERLDDGGCDETVPLEQILKIEHR